jgi:oligosaccharide repeat unit polymerase
MKIIRIIAIISLVLLGVFSFWMDYLFFSYINTFLLVVVLLTHFFNEKRLVSPILFWILGFITIISPEILFNQESILKDFSLNAVEETVRYISLCNIAFLTFNEIFESQAKIFTKSSQLNLYLLELRGKYKENFILRKNHFGFFIFSMLIVFILLYGKTAIDTFLLGRAKLLGDSSTLRSFSELLLDTVVSIGKYALSASILYYYLFLKQKLAKIDKFYLYLSIFAIIIIEVLAGIRSPLVVTLISIYVILVYRFGISTFQKLISPIFVLGFAAVLFFMKNFRTFGSKSTSIDSYVSTQDVQDAEGVVRWLTMIVQHFDSSKLKLGSEHLSVFLFFIPRAIWPDKPLQLEFWAPREFSSAIYTDQFSMAASFSATAYVDFGFFGGIVLWGIFGLFVGYVNYNISSKIANGKHINIIFYSIWCGLLYFCIRQFSYFYFLVATTIIYILLLNIVSISRHNTKKERPNYKILDRLNKQF